MKVRLVSSIAVACCVACPWQWLAAEEEIKYPSPDGRFALSESKMVAGKVMLTLHSGSDTESFNASEAVLVWSADSKRGLTPSNENFFTFSAITTSR